MLNKSVFVLLLATCFVLAADEVTHTTDPLATVKKNVAEKKAVLIDTREQSEWDEGHLRDAVLLPLSKLSGKGDRSALVKDLPKDRPLYIHCRSGKRCLATAKALKALGFDVRPLKAGYDELVEAGFTRATR